MNDAFIVALCAIAALSASLMVLALTTFSDPEHVKGLDKIESLTEEMDIGGGLKRICVVWANFDPETAESFEAGQKYQSYCRVEAK